MDRERGSGEMQRKEGVGCRVQYVEADDAGVVHGALDVVLAGEVRAKV